MVWLWCKICFPQVCSLLQVSPCMACAAIKCLWYHHGLTEVILMTTKVHATQPSDCSEGWVHHWVSRTLKYIPLLNCTQALSNDIWKHWHMSRLMFMEDSLKPNCIFIFKWIFSSFFFYSFRAAHELMHHSWYGKACLIFLAPKFHCLWLTSLNV